MSFGFARCDFCQQTFACSTLRTVLTRPSYAADDSIYAMVSAAICARCVELEQLRRDAKALAAPDDE